MAVIEGSSALLMWQLVSDNLLREHAWTQIVKKLRTALTLFSLIPLRLGHVSEVLNCSAFQITLVVETLLLQFH